MDYNNGGYFEDRSRNGASQNNDDERLPSTIRPVTIKQLLDATSSSPADNLAIDGEKVSRVKIVGVIRAIVNNDRLKYTIEDGTGSMEFIIQNRRNNDGADMQLDDYGDTDGPSYPQETGVYVEVVCLTRPGAEKRMNYIVNIREVRDFNIVLYHYLEAIKAHVFFVKKNNLGGNFGNDGADNDGGIFVSQSGDVSEQERMELEITKYIFDHMSPDTSNGVSLKPFLDSTGGKEQDYRQVVNSMFTRGVLDDDDDLYQFINPDEQRDRLRAAGMI